jgi:hypothetical protein
MISAGRSQRRMPAPGDAGHPRLRPPHDLTWSTPAAQDGIRLIDDMARTFIQARPPCGSRFDIPTPVPSVAGYFSWRRSRLFSARTRRNRPGQVRYERPARRPARPSITGILAGARIATTAALAVARRR